MATRRKLIKEHGQHWDIYIVNYQSNDGQRPCVDCGQYTITRATGNDEEALCNCCAAWRLGMAEGKREAREGRDANAFIDKAAGNVLPASLTAGKDGGR